MCGLSNMALAAGVVLYFLKFHFVWHAAFFVHIKKWCYYKGNNQLPQRDYFHYIPFVYTHTQRFLHCGIYFLPSGFQHDSLSYHNPLFIDGAK